MKRRVATVTLKPREGRQNLVRQPTDRECRPFPCPLPRRAGEGGQKGVGVSSPGLSPWATIFRPSADGLVRLTSRITGTGH